MTNNNLSLLNEEVTALVKFLRIASKEHPWEVVEFCHANEHDVKALGDLAREITTDVDEVAQHYAEVEQERFQSTLDDYFTQPSPVNGIN